MKLMYKSKMIKYMLVAIFALLPNLVWGDDIVNSKEVYLQDCKNQYGGTEGVGVVIDDLETLLLSNNLLVKSADGASYDVAQKKIYLSMKIYSKADNSLQEASSFNIHRSNQYGFSKITTKSLNDWPNVCYVSTNSVVFYSNNNTTIFPADLQYKILQDGTSNPLTDYKVEFSASTETPTIENGLVTNEPNIALKVVYNIKNRPFKHYKGYANADGDFEVIDASKNQLRQKVAKWEYTYVVDDKAPNNKISLQLPLEDYEGSGHSLEPLGYFRWYNYDTDNASANLKAEGGTSTLLKSISDDYNDKGLIAYNISAQTHANHTTVGVIYNRPSDADWEGETIACDVSRYVDGMDDGLNYLDHECTLSMRYIFHIIPATKMADEIKDALVEDNGVFTYEDNKNITVGFKEDNSKMTLRLDLVNPNMYYFYPMNNTSKHVYYPSGSSEEESANIESQRKITASDFSDEIKIPSSLEWRAYNGDKDKMCILGAGNVDNFPRFYDVSISTLNGATWTNLDGTNVNKPTFNPGDHFYLVAYVKDGEGNSCPIANFSCRYFRYYPKRVDEMGDADITRRISYLEENYTNVATVSFDNDSPEQNLSAPTDANDNQSKQPSSWNKRSYGFVYRDLIDKTGNAGSTSVYDDPKHSPLHGEYGIYKTANVKGISGSGEGGTDGYVWYTTKQLYDRTYEQSNHSQLGSFLYVDASDESRTIASAEFQANLCTGQQMAFSAAVADMTNQTVKPQIMFKLFGIERDGEGNETAKTLLHSFSSGDFLEVGNQGKWYQVFGKITLQKESSVENYSDFRIEIDNFSKGTLGADYCVDDIRIYVKPAKVEVYQDRPACGDSETGTIKLKIRAIHETLNALLGHKDTKIHFRFVQEDGTPLEQDGLYDYTLDGTLLKMPKGYASVDVYDSEEKCMQHTIDGVPMIETDADGERYIILGNHNFPLKKGKKYYVAVCTDSDPSAANAVWGNPADVCSIYSDWFELIGQMPFISDTDGNVVSDYRVNCNDDSYEVKLTGNLTTVNPNTGEKVTLTGVKYLWYLDGKGDDACLNPDAPSADITISATKISLGLHTIYMKPVSDTKNAAGETVYTINGVSYLLCDEAIPVTLRVLKAGPELNFGFNDVDYPFKDGEFEASLRIGLPQIKKLKDKDGCLQVPLHSADYLTTSTEKTLSFIDDTKSDAATTSSDVYVATTNDPLWNATGATLLNSPVATLQKPSIGEIVSGTQSTLGLKFKDDVLTNFHEGYWYELRFVFEQRGESDGTTNCPGEAYLKVKIVPEFVTWRPTASGGMNANWNNDANWHRSSSAELYDDSYTDYQAYASGESSKANGSVEIPTIDNYVPMKFTKVTIDNLNGLPFPDLGNVVYRQSNGIATKLTNGKGNEASKYIQYDILAYWDEAATNKGLGVGYASGTSVSGNDLKCEKFYGNTCHQIYFKPQGELRDQCYLVYDKAWVEKELKPNTWYTMASPLQYIYAGDMYVPANNGRQETKAFTDIKFSDTDASSGKALYSRSLYPVYQRAWMKSDVQEITASGNYPASHYPSGTEATEVDVNLGYWSHIYNKVDESYAADGTFGGFSIKAGNSLLPKDKDKNALLRLPKEDASYAYYEYNGSSSSTSATVSKGQEGHGKLLVAYNNEEKHLAPMSQSLGSDNSSGFYLVANPYTCSLSLKKFFEANTGLQKAVWIVEGSTVKSVSENDLADKDFAIQPTQSFFVKKVFTSGADDVNEVKFTSQMYVDRTITAGLQIASDYLKTVNITTQDARGYQSQARISLRPEASLDFDEEEDVDLLYDQNLKEVPQVYTVAGSEAVAVNALPTISWVPMGVVSEKTGLVSLTLQGLACLDAPLYLYDVATASFLELHDGEAVQIQAGEHGRYFLTQSRTATDVKRVEAEAQKSRLAKYYSVEAGRVVVTELDKDKPGKKPAYTLDGKRISLR